MDHVVYLDTKAKELQNLKSGAKTMIARGAMGRKLPHGRVHAGDVLYFSENKGDGLVKARAEVADVFHSPQLSKEESARLIADNQDKLRLDRGLQKRFGGKRYLVLIRVRGFKELACFKIDRSAYGNMDDWLPVEDINRVKIGS